MTTRDERPELCERHAAQVWAYLWLVGPGDDRPTDTAVRFALKTLDNGPCAGVGHTLCQATALAATGDCGGGAA